MGSEALAKVEKKAPPSQPGLEPGSSAYMTDALPLPLLGSAHVQIGSVHHLTTQPLLHNISLVLFEFNLSPMLQFKILILSVRDAQWRRDSPVGAEKVH